MVASLDDVTLLILTLSSCPVTIVLTVRAIPGGFLETFLISLELANARALSEETGRPPLIPLDEVAAHLDSDRQEALFADALNQGAQSWTTGSGDGLFADLCDEEQFLDDSGTGGSIVLTSVRTGS